MAVFVDVWYVKFDIWYETFSLKTRKTGGTRKDQEKYKKSELAKILGSSNRELTNEEILNRDYYQGRFASKTKSGKIVYNWDDNIKHKNIVQI